MTALNEPTIATDGLRPTHVEVDLDVLAGNYRAIAAHVAPARVMPILKANAYGHGLVEVARLLERLAAPCVGVAYLEEGLRLRQHGVRLPVLVLGGILGSQIPRFLEHDLTLTASSVDKLRAIEEHAAAAGRADHVLRDCRSRGRRRSPATRRPEGRSGRSGPGRRPAPGRASGVGSPLPSHG